MKNQKPVFVYGTLREGFGNYDYHLKGRVTSIQPATLKGFEMYSVGGFPAIMPKDDEEVVGEVMMVDEDMYDQVMEGMDRLEGYREYDEERSMYLRRPMMVTTEDGEKVEAFVYIWNRSIPGPKVESGDWKQYEEEENRSFRRAR